MSSLGSSELVAASLTDLVIRMMMGGKGRSAMDGRMNVRAVFMPAACWVQDWLGWDKPIRALTRPVGFTPSTDASAMASLSTRAAEPARVLVRVASTFLCPQETASSG